MVLTVDVGMEDSRTLTSILGDHGIELIANTAAPPRVAVVPAGVAPPENVPLAAAARKLASARLQGRQVQLLLSPHQDPADHIRAIIEVADDEGPFNLAEALLSEGLAIAHQSGPYEIDWYLECHYGHLQQSARERRAGIWR